jgi:SAM-dependent methyltransferase
VAEGWREFWNRDTPIYVNGRHKALHYEGVAADIAALVPGPEAVVLDHGCGEALCADRVAAACGRLVLLDAAPLVRERLRARFGSLKTVSVIAPEDLAGLPDGGLDLAVANSLAQYLTRAELAELLGLWRAKLKPGGRLVLADILPPDLSALADAGALLAFAARGGFLAAAVAGLARTALSDYRRLREALGLARYGEAEMLALLREAGYRARRLPRNLGHNQNRMAFEAVPA